MIVSPDVKEGGRSVPLKWNACLLSLIDIDDVGYAISFRRGNLIVIDASRYGRIGIDAPLSRSFD
jgi:hypothetical protein